MTWRKSSYSANTTDCVEVHGSLTLVRDSKNPHGPVLSLRDADVFRRFISTMRAGLGGLDADAVE